MTQVNVPPKPADMPDNVWQDLMQVCQPPKDLVEMWCSQYGNWRANILIEGHSTRWYFSSTRNRWRRSK